MTGISPAHLEAILLHELAHIRRLDYLINLLQTIVETLLCYHPAVWWVSRQIRIERENCCDDVAVNVLGGSRDYAIALTRMEELRAEEAGASGQFRGLLHGWYGHYLAKEGRHAALVRIVFPPRAGS